MKLRYIGFGLSIGLTLGVFGGIEPVLAKRVAINDEAAKELPTQEGVKNAPPTGKKEAVKYFEKREPAAGGGGTRDHYLALHLGGFINSESYVWGTQTKAEDVGKLNLGVSYRMGEWISAADLLFRADFQSYEVDDSKPFKMSLIFAAVFPDSNSRFPMYFGAGAGPGIFFKQARSESPISLDYQLFGGFRMFDVFESIGFFAEAGMKNHLLLLSDGQFNSTFFAVGALFTF